MQKYQLVLLGFLFTFQLSKTVAQHNDCNALLKGGVFDYSSSISSQDNIKRVLSYLDKKSYKSTSSLKQDAMGLSIGLPNIGSLGMNSSGGVSYSGTTYSSFTKLYQDNSIFRSALNQQVSTASSAILNAFNDCITRTQGNKYRIWARYDNDFSKIIVSIQRVLQDPFVPVLKITKVISPEATPATDYIGQVIGNDPINLAFNIAQNSTSDLFTFDIWTNDSTGSYRPHIEVNRIQEAPQETGIVETPLPTRLLITTKTRKMQNDNKCEEEIWIYLNGLSAGWRLELPGNTFAPNKIDRFYINVGMYLGDINSVKIVRKKGRSNSCNGNEKWECEYVEIENLRTGRKTNKLFRNKQFSKQNLTATERNITWR